MKRIILFALLFWSGITFSQVPQKMSYQAVVRNAQNQLIQNNAVGMRISILQGSPIGTAVYVETHVPVTNGNGSATIEIGNGTVVSGVFSNIDWSTGQYWLQTEIDPQGANGYSITGVSQLLTVPYAFYCEYAANGGVTITSVVDNGNGTLTFNYSDGSTYTTGVLTGLQGANGQSAYEIWVAQGNVGSQADFLDSLQGFNALFITTIEPSGLNCADGGIKIEIGLDTNRNDTLEIGEINPTLTSYVCNGGSASLIAGNGIEINGDTISNTYGPKFVTNVPLVNYTGQNISQTYTTIDISAYVPPGATYAILNVMATSQEYYRLDFRANNLSQGMYEPGHLKTWPNLWIRESQFMVPLDSGGTFDYMFYKFAGNTDGTLTIDLVGYY